MYIAPTQIFSEFAAEYLIQLLDIAAIFRVCKT